jgi:hypothetical protein
MTKAIYFIFLYILLTMKWYVVKREREDLLFMNEIVIDFKFFYHYL